MDYSRFARSTEQDDLEGRAFYEKGNAWKNSTMKIKKKKNTVGEEKTELRNEFQFVLQRRNDACSQGLEPKKEYG